MMKQINRMEVVLAEQNRIEKWLAETIGENEATVSRWCTNETQPSVNTSVLVAKAVDKKELFNSTK
jgi:hypothetical protein